MGIMNCAEFSRATGWPLATVRRWCNQGIIRHVRLGRVMLFDDEAAKKAIEQLPNLRGCQVHTTVMLSEVDRKIFKKLGVDLTCEPVSKKQKSLIG